MKIIFYDIKETELNSILEKMPNQLEPYFLKFPLSPSSYVDEKYQDAQAISVFISSTLNKEILSKFKNLKYIFLRSTGFSNVDLEYCKENNIEVFNVPNYGSSTVAEYAFALLLELSRKISYTKTQLKNGIIDFDDLAGFELKNKTIGIIGLGSIGRKIVNIAHGFNMEVLAYDTNKKGVYNFVELDELLKNSDVVVITCPLTPQTNQLIDRFELSKMKKSAIIINVARGEIINTQALYNALIEKKIKGAALDVIECEETLCQKRQTCQDYDNIRMECYRKYFFIQKLMNLDNVIITPHNAYNSAEAQERIINTTLSNIKQTLSNNNLHSSYKNLVLL